MPTILSGSINPAASSSALLACTRLRVGLRHHMNRDFWRRRPHSRQGKDILPDGDLIERAGHVNSEL